MTRIIIPQLDANLVDVTITAWKKAPGEQLEKGETIAELTTDKAVYELEAPESGELLQIVAPENWKSLSFSSRPKWVRFPIPYPIITSPWKRDSRP